MKATGGFLACGDSRSHSGVPLPLGHRNPQRPFCHLVCLRDGFVKARLKVRRLLFPGHVEWRIAYCQPVRLNFASAVPDSKVRYKEAVHWRVGLKSF